MATTNEKYSEFHLRFANPLLAALRALGGSGTSAEVIQWIIDHEGISEEEQAKTLAKTGVSRVRARINWSKFFLDRGGYVASSRKGVWELTSKGENAVLTHRDLSELQRSVYLQIARERSRKPETPEDECATETSEASESSSGYREELMALLLTMPPAGFERLCQRLLREAGFVNVIVTGKSGDGGIDGHGLLQVNPLVSFKVLFQCKRYQGSVSTSTIRDFRGAMQGRADKGIILTTGTFTSSACAEAVRDGAAPIELLDGEKILDLFANLELGLTPRQDYDVDRVFFEQYMQ